MRRNRLLPEPDGPVMARHSPAPSSRSNGPASWLRRLTIRSRGLALPHSSWPGLCRPSAPSRAWMQDAGRRIHALRPRRTSPAAGCASGCRDGSSAARTSRSGCAPGHRPGRSPSAGCRCRARCAATSPPGSSRRCPSAPPACRIPRRAPPARRGPRGFPGSPRCRACACRSSNSTVAPGGRRSADEALELLEHLVRVLARHQPERHLGRRLAMRSPSCCRRRYSRPTCR